ncbi:molybdate ABC transporter substrate-binding protein [Rhizobium sp. PEPV16]|uniref:molybdate ABC transporter substrate-binding protein n=1 Tax=Rhizobium sp. PEPV16 TaxID=1820614 RepID=UPI00124DF079|nr:molybdate ABC transporter substrate-binding protein [Rhizobium sp. PEPV16]KAF5881381.1 molybdate ABC transporter substrate-binding protein [Rhizobium sp. PEPV16]
MYGRSTTRRLMLAAGIIALISSTAVGHAIAHDSTIPNIAAASDLKFAAEEIAASFKAVTGKSVQLTFGSSGNFFRQIAQGAPFQMFMSADEGFVSQLQAEGKTVDEGSLYAIGRIVLFAPKGSPLKTEGGLDDLKAAMADGRVSKFAIANPEHAPYGRAAEEALRHQGLWKAIELKLVLGENVSQAAQFATSGSTQGGIFAYSLALSPAISKLGTYTLLPADWHEPLRQRMVLINGAGETAKAFYDYMQKPAARAIFRKYGFVLPGEQS